MEKAEAYSTSLGINDLENTYGRWIRHGNVYVENAVDCWHKGTCYFVAGNPIPLDVLDKKLFETLLYCNDDKAMFSLQIVKRQLIYVPVAKSHDVDCIVFDDTDGRYPWIDGLNKEHDCLRPLILRKLSTQSLQEIGSSALPISKHFSDFAENVQHFSSVDGEKSILDMENVSVTFVPVAVLEFKIKGETFIWAAVNDSSSDKIHTPHSLKENPELKLDSEFEESTENNGGCLSIILITLGAIILGYNLWPDSYESKFWSGFLKGILKLIGYEIVYLIIALFLFHRIIITIYKLIKKIWIRRKIKKRTEFLHSELNV